MSTFATSVSQAEKEKREAQQKLEEANKKANEAQQKIDSAESEVVTLSSELSTLIADISLLEADIEYKNKFEKLRENTMQLRLGKNNNTMRWRRESNICMSEEIPNI